MGEGKGNDLDLKRRTASAEEDTQMPAVKKAQDESRDALKAGTRTEGRADHEGNSQSDSARARVCIAQGHDVRG